MDFNDTPKEATYRAKAHEFLASHAPSKKLPQQDLASQPPQVELLKAAKIWQSLKADHGFACITWPKEFGGPGGSAIESVIFCPRGRAVRYSSWDFSGQSGYLYADGDQTGSRRCKATIC